MNITFPPPVKPGATFGVVAPGSPPSDDEKIQRGVDYLQSKGCNVILGESVYAREGYLSGSDEVRSNDINRMFEREDVDAIICTRGGYGCTRILDRLDYKIIRANPKPFIGFSDITALHMALFTQSSLVSYAGPMLAVELQTTMPVLTELSFWDCLGKRLGSRITVVEKVNPSGYERDGVAEGRLVGGNMAVFTSLIGTKFFPDLAGSILLLEDIGEPVYKIDRMFSQLRNCGFLNQIRGVILGSFTGIPVSDPDRMLSQVVKEYLEPVGIPVMDGFPFGHTALKFTLPMGARLTMDVRARSLTWEGLS